jgi:hypothetical protein
MRAHIAARGNHRVQPLGLLALGALILGMSTLGRRPAQLFRAPALGRSTLV